MYRIAPARAEDVELACRVMYDGFVGSAPQMPKDFFERYVEHDPYFQPECIRLGWKDDRIAATVQVFLRECWDGFGYQTLGGIGSVTTHPDFRGQGLSVLVMQDAVEYMKAIGLQISTLYSGHSGLYEKVGYRHYERINIHGVVTGEQKLLTPLKDTSRARELYECSTGKLPGTIRREKIYWSTWIDGMRMQDYDTVYSASGDTYVIYQARDDGAISIQDFGCISDPDTIANLIEMAFAGRSIHISCLDSNHPWLPALRSALSLVTTDPCISLMVQQFGGYRMPEMFCETWVDYF